MAKKSKKTEEKKKWNLRESKFYKENYGKLLTLGVMLEINWIHKNLYLIFGAIHTPVVFYSGFVLFESEFSLAIETLFFGVFLVLGNLGCISFKKSTLVEIMRTLDHKLDDYGSTIDPEINKMIEKEKKRFQERKHLRTKVMTYALYGATISLLVLKPIVEYFFVMQKGDDLYSKNVNRVLPIKLWYFFDVRYIGTIILMIGVEYYIALQTLFIAAGNAVAYMVISDELCSNLFVLNLALRHLIRRAKFIGNGEVNKSNLNECFRRCVIHHQNIIRCFQLFQKYFYWVIWFVVTICTYQICVSGLLLTLESTETMDIGVGVRMVALTFLTGQILYLFFFCLYGEEIEEMSNETYYAAYEMDWIDYSIEMKQNLQILRIRALSPLKFSCGGLFYANFDTFSNVMNGAYSYFSLLKASINKKG